MDNELEPGYRTHVYRRQSVEAGSLNKACEKNSQVLGTVYARNPRTRHMWLEGDRTQNLASSQRRKAGGG